MSDSPFNSKAYYQAWINHFEPNSQLIKIDYLDGIHFFKNSKWPFYHNVGKNFTNKQNYSFNSTSISPSNKVALIYDVQDFELQDDHDFNNFKVKRIKQYPGYFCDLTKFETIDDLKKYCFKSSKSRYNFDRSTRVLETKFNISYKVYFGAISDEDYFREMKALKKLLAKRFDAKGTFNTVLPIWDFYLDLVLPLIKEKKANLNVIYNDNEPIAMSINFIAGSQVIIAIRTFDIDYNRNNIGNIEIYKLLEWAMDFNMQIVDFSKGNTDYKKRWSTNEYHFENHIIYQKGKLTPAFIGNVLSMFFKTKQYLRDKNVNTLYTKMKYKIKGA
ncbi:MAG: hypothetical protein BM564_11990 [Bacteroidetes bacterium MedPE-SWsnd-G2]|nr:MAG: hypothetical protein BM564_11990 [Bacteroidetes bacterium MedPE-SWsnd-G2]